MRIIPSTVVLAMSDHLCNIIDLFISVHPYLIINVQLFSYIFSLILVIDYKK